jgi:hypothetical protein
MPRITGKMTHLANVGGVAEEGALYLSGESSASIWSGGSGYYLDINFDSSRVFSRNGPEVATASISAYLCIKY